MPSSPPRRSHFIETVLSASRWVMVPFYFGLLIALLILLGRFGLDLVRFVGNGLSMTDSDVILGILSLIDLVLVGSLVLIVVLSGYENFVSKIDVDSHPDWPEWMREIDFAGLKQKLLASIVAISGISLLKAFVNIEKGYSDRYLTWLVVIHVVFVLSSLVLALSDRLAAGAKKGS